MNLNDLANLGQIVGAIGAMNQNDGK
jgi:hypothetical protein